MQKLAWIGVLGAMVMGLTLGCATGELPLELPDVVNTNNQVYPPDVLVPDVAVVDVVTQDVGPGEEVGLDVVEDAVVEDVGPDSVVEDAGPEVSGCVGGCGAREVCENDVCVDACGTAVCGSVTRAGQTAICGACAGGAPCESGVCVDVCAQVGAQCGSMPWGGSSVSCGNCSGATNCFDNRCAEPVGYRQVTAGFNHTCAIRAQGGGVHCWGANDIGQLGNNAAGTDSNAAVYVFNLSTARSVSSHTNHTCVSRDDNQVRCWGLNSRGQLGNGSVVNAPVPVETTNVFTAASIANGGAHTCARNHSGEILCWGANGQGQLGNGEILAGDFNHVKSIVKLNAQDNMGDNLAIALGSAHSCALRSDQTVWCWGFNQVGQVGQSNMVQAYRWPTKITQIEGAISIASGLNHSCAVNQAGQVWCWGEGIRGQLGNGLTARNHVPVRAEMPTRAVRVVAGFNHSCAIDVNRDVYCWGDNGRGQLGAGLAATSRATPIKVSGLSNVLSLSGGYQHTCAVRSNGTAHCWGDNEFGQLGDRSNTMRNVPVAVSVN
ncbi:MAG: hypothetical protein H0U74_04495 [Bradymonadaceae bacterium]|nr:hypothetical protein [Lujinxingiaceae bacterium]